MRWEAWLVGVGLVIVGWSFESWKARMEKLMERNNQLLREILDRLDQP